MNRFYSFSLVALMVLMTALVSSDIVNLSLVKDYVIDETIPFNAGTLFPDDPAAGFVQQDCKTRTYDIYTNNRTKSVYLVAVDLWMGLFKDSYADITLELYKVDVTGRTMYLDDLAQDRYNNPSLPHSEYKSFSPYVIEIKPQEKIRLNGLNCFVDGNPSPMHPKAILYLNY